jgi:hypothetical protein
MGYPASFVRLLQYMYSVKRMSILNGSDVAGVVCDVSLDSSGLPLYLFISSFCTMAITRAFV